MSTLDYNCLAAVLIGAYLLQCTYSDAPSNPNKNSYIQQQF